MLIKINDKNLNSLFYEIFMSWHKKAYIKFINYSYAQINLNFKYQTNHACTEHVQVYIVARWNWGSIISGEKFNPFSLSYIVKDG